MKSECARVCARVSVSMCVSPVSFGFPACSDGIWLTAVAACFLVCQSPVSRAAYKFLQKKKILVCKASRADGRAQVCRVAGQSTSVKHGSGEICATVCFFLFFFNLQSALCLWWCTLVYRPEMAQTVLQLNIWWCAQDISRGMHLFVLMPRHLLCELIQIS